MDRFLMYTMALLITLLPLKVHALQVSFDLEEDNGMWRDVVAVAGRIEKEKDNPREYTISVERVLHGSAALLGNALPLEVERHNSIKEGNYVVLLYPSKEQMVIGKDKYCLNNFISLSLGSINNLSWVCS